MGSRPRCARTSHTRSFFCAWQTPASRARRSGTPSAISPPHRLVGGNPGRETNDLTFMWMVGECERLRRVHRKHHSGRTARPCDDGKLSDAGDRSLRKGTWTSGDIVCSVSSSLDSRRQTGHRSGCRSERNGITIMRELSSLTQTDCGHVRSGTLATAPIRCC
jgi:hypothetical protein